MKTNAAFAPLAAAIEAKLNAAEADLQVVITPKLGTPAKWNHDPQWIYKRVGALRLELAKKYADKHKLFEQTGTEADYKAVNALQAQYKITPLSAWGKPYTPVAPPVNANPGFSMTDKPQTVILDMGTEGYFNLMAKLMAAVTPAPAADAPMLASMASAISTTRPNVFASSSRAPLATPRQESWSIPAGQHRP